MTGKYTVTTYGTVYRSNGPTYGCKGSIGGLSREDVKSQIMHHKKRGDSMEIKDDQGFRVPLREFS